MEIEIIIYDEGKWQGIVRSKCSLEEHNIYVQEMLLNVKNQVLNTYYKNNE